MQLRAATVAAAIGGRLEGPDADLEGACIDSRTLRPGQLFVPIVAERDGHDFIPAALAAGAAGYLTARDPQGGTAIVVDDTADALVRLGSAARDRLPDRVVGITGSVGKTTVKDLLAAVLRTTSVVAASERSLNNELGVPLTLANAPDGTEVAVVEMGARGRGHIAALCDIARPTVGVVSTVGLAHAEQFGGIEAIAATKAELVEALPAAAHGGVAVLNADVAEVAAMTRRTSARVVTFGVDGDVGAEETALDEHLCAHFVLRSPWGSAPVRLPVRGFHQVANALAAAAAALVLGVSVESVAAGLAAAELSPWRMDLQVAPGGVRILNDAYNANPVSVVAALRALAHLDARRRIAVLGPMAELGSHSEGAHREVAVEAEELGVELIAVDAPSYGSTAHHVADLDAASEALGHLGEGDVVLVKGSRVAGLERLAGRLLDPT